MAMLRPDRGRPLGSNKVAEVISAPHAGAIPQSSESERAMKEGVAENPHAARISEMNES
jgi:hypothetical protein